MTLYTFDEDYDQLRWHLQTKCSHVPEYTMKELVNDHT